MGDALEAFDDNPIRLVVHGLAVELSLAIGDLHAPLHRLFAGFEDPVWPPGILSTTGQIRPYDQSEVARHLSRDAIALHAPGDATELFGDGERFWRIDDRWGITELNLLKGQFRAWLLPQRRVDDLACLEMAVLWPLAQILRSRGLYLMPAVSVARDGWGVLLLTSHGIEPELRALAEAGYQIIGQRWTALREESNRISLLHLPGPLERSIHPHLPTASATPPERWVDLTHEYVDVPRHHAFCDVVLLAAPGRRSHARILPLSESAATHALRRDWPMTELHPLRRTAQMPTRLQRFCDVDELHLSRRPDDFATLLDSLRPLASPLMPGAPRPARRAMAG